MTKERYLLARAGLIVAKYRFKEPDDRNLEKLAQDLNKYFEDNQLPEKHHKIGQDDE